MQKKEIERRFLLRRIPIVNWDHIYDITQHYIRDEQTNITKRLRATYSVLKDEPRKIEYLHKINVGVGEFIEVHEEFDPADYKQTIKKAFKWLGKRRYIYNFKGLKFEVDVIDGVSLVLMEVELDDINQDIEFPDEIKKEIMAEVTGIKGLSNLDLANSVPNLSEELSNS